MTLVMVGLTCIDTINQAITATTTEKTITNLFLAKRELIENFLLI